MSSESIAILSVSAGAGHVRAAQALETWIRRDYPQYTPAHIDVMDCVPKLFRNVYADSYIKIVKRHPALWGYLYHRTDRESRGDSKLRKLRVAIERLNTRKLMSRLREIQPRTIICTHFLPPELLSRLIRLGKTDVPCWVQVTDFDIHALWVHEHMSGYFTASDELAHRLHERGIPMNRIHVTGIPIMPVFSNPPDRRTCAAKLGTDPDRTTLALMSGGMGVSSINLLAERLLRIEGDIQIIALAGKNAQLLELLNELAEQHPGRLFPLEYTETIEAVMAASDLAVSKPGGLTTSECLAMGLPMIVVAPIPGQEERNADFLLENGAALKAHDEPGLEYRVRQLLHDRRRLVTMQEAATRIGKPFAARDVLRIAIGNLDHAGTD